MIETIIPRAPLGGDSGGGSGILHCLSVHAKRETQAKRSFDSLPLSTQIAAALVIGMAVYFGIPLACGALCNLLGVG